VKMFRSIAFAVCSLAASTTVLLAAGVGGATASSSIEGVWSFNGGAVDIAALPDGSFDGVVTVQTKFAQCYHQVNEKMWTDIRSQADGSYWGNHQWFFESAGASGCAVNPTPGPTAWRVLQTSLGDRFLRVCFSAPGSSQPAIAPSGSSTNVTYGCVDSAAIAPLPVVSAKEGAGTPGAGEFGFRQSVKLPDAKACVRHRVLKIKLSDPKYDPFKEVVIRVNGKKVIDIRGVKKLGKAIALKHLPLGTYTVKVLAITVLDQRLSGSRRYSACGKSSGNLKLKHPGHHKSKK
jgi:hypothetical protein